jgi:hypothetical protein
MELSCQQVNRAARLDELESLITKALASLAATRGRTEAAQLGTGATRFLLERSLASLAVIRTDVLSPIALEADDV